MDNPAASSSTFLHWDFEIACWMKPWALFIETERIVNNGLEHLVQWYFNTLIYPVQIKGNIASISKCWTESKEQVQQSYWRIHCESVLSGYNKIDAYGETLA